MRARIELDHARRARGGGIIEQQEVHPARLPREHTEIDAVGEDAGAEREASAGLTRDRLSEFAWAGQTIPRFIGVCSSVKSKPFFKDEAFDVTGAGRAPSNSVIADTPYMRLQSWGNYRAPALTSIKAEGHFPRVPSHLMSLAKRH